MEPILTTIALTLAAKCTTTYITETVLGGWLGNRADNIIAEKIPSLSKRLLAQFKDTETPVNHHLQKVILSSHWLATKVFAEQLSKTNNSPVFKRIISIADEQINLLKKEDYQLKTVSPDTYETDSLIFKDHESRVTEKLRDKVIEYHTIILFDLLQNFKYDNAECILFKNALKNGLPPNNIDWFQLACSFLNELLKGDNNKAKDAFQNQELAKIAFGIDGLKKELMQGFETLANKYVKSIGEERFNEFMNWLGEDLKNIKGTLIKIKDVVISTQQDILEIKGLVKRELNLNNFPDYKTLLSEIEELNIAFKDKRAEEQETFDFLQNESDERKRNHFEKDLSSITQALLTIDNARTTKENEYNEFRNNIEKTWLSLYSDNVPNSPRLVKARELFDVGNLQAANMILDPQLLQQDSDLLKKAKDFIQQKEEVLAQEYIAKANFTVLAKDDKNWFTEANEYYLKAVELYENYDNYFFFAYFLHEHNEILEAIEWYEKAMLLSSNILEKATTLNNLGNLHKTKNDFVNASSSYEKALSIHRELAQNNPQTYLPYVAETLNNLGNLQKAKNDFNSAYLSYEEALIIHRYLASVNQQTYLPDFAMTLNNLADLHSNKHDFDKAENNYCEALKIRRELVRVNPQVYLSDLSKTLNNLGVLQFNKSNFDKSEENYNEALSIRKQLSMNNPKVYLPYVATTLNNLGSVMMAKNKIIEAEKSYEEALIIRRQLVCFNPDAYYNDLGVTLNNLGNVKCAKSEFDEAEKNYQEALDIRNELSHQNPDAYQINLAETLLSFANFHLNYVKNMDKSLGLAYHAFINAVPYHQQVPKALHFCQQAVQIWQAWGEDLLKYLEENQQAE